MTTPVRRPPPKPPQYFDGGRMVLWSVILVALVGSLGYAAYTSGPSAFGGFDVAMKVSADPVIVPLSGENAGKVTMTVDIQNRTANVQKLSAPAACKIFRWILFGEGERFVQTQSEDCAPSLMELVLQPNERKSETIDVAVDAARLKPGERYQFILEYWGLRGVLVVHAADE
jgi:hypothetical protein